VTLFASLIPFVCWLVYARVIGQADRWRPSLTTLMRAQRRRWVSNAVRRETPFDAILSSTIMGAVSFFASTTVLLILTLFAVFGQVGAIHDALAAISPASHFTGTELRVHLAVLLAMFSLAFLDFTLSLRQFNHYCILLGAVDHHHAPDEAEVDAITALNALGARYFNNGIRAYYFSAASMAWFISAGAAIAATLIVVAFVVYREFFSAPYAIVEKLRDR
jgi:uncharacterized membrane protein